MACTQVGIILYFRRVSGAKSFSSCSFEDFENFLKHNPECPYIRVARRGPLPRAAVCGNGVMEHGEQCDCGSVAVSAGQRGAGVSPALRNSPRHGLEVVWGFIMQLCGHARRCSCPLPLGPLRRAVC